MVDYSRTTGEGVEVGCRILIYEDPAVGTKLESDPAPTLAGAEVVHIAPRTANGLGVEEFDVRDDNNVAVTVTRWLKALPTGDEVAVLKRSSLPFSLRTSNAVKHCEGDIGESKSLRVLLGCLRQHEASLLDEIDAAKTLEVSIKDLRSVSITLRPLVHDIQAHELLAVSVINGDGVTYLLALVLRPDGGYLKVRTLAVDTQFETQ